MAPQAFWGAVRNHRDELVHRDHLSMVAMRASAPMDVILRTTERLFTVAAPTLVGRSAKVIINANFYDVSNSGLSDAFFGHDPVPASATTPLGQLVEGGRVVAGSSKPQMFYWAQVRTMGLPAPGQSAADLRAYESGFGNPPIHPGVREAIGGLGPMIIAGLKYGDGNRYRAGAPSGAPTTGAPPANAASYLIQRNNNTFKAAASLPQSTGKTVLGYAPSEGCLLVIVQQHGSRGQRLETIRDRLFELGFTDSVFLDGSDSSCLWFDGSWRIMPGENKDETNTIGIAFG